MNGQADSRALGHRDLLGAIMALGIKRELIGDILPRARAAMCFVWRRSANISAPS